MKKINKEFVLSDSSLNCYSFRLLTSGYQISEFARNPIGYYMHERNGGVVVRWEDLEIKGDQVVGKPVINTSNPKGKQIIEEIESGFLNAASMGCFIVLESSDDDALKVPGQAGPTITKWYNKECSIVDIPGNSNALALYDSNNEPITLNDLKAMSLKAGNNHSKQKDFRMGLQSVDDLLRCALKDNTVNEETLFELKKQYSNNPIGLQNILEGLGRNRLSYLISLSWDYLDKNNLLPELKNRSLESFRMKYRQAFNKEFIIP